MHRAKEGDREGYRKRVRERDWKRERDGEWERSPQFGGLSISGPSNRGRFGLLLKMDVFVSFNTFEVILIQKKFLRIHNISIIFVS